MSFRRPSVYLSLRSRFAPVGFRRTTTRHASQTPFPAYVQDPPSSPKPKTPWFRVAVYTGIPFLLCYSMMHMVADEMFPNPPSVERDKQIMATSLEKMDHLSLVKKFRSDTEWLEWDAYSGLDEDSKKHRLTGGPLGGSHGVGVQRIFWNEKKRVVSTVIMFGSGTCGWIHTVHGGILATILDETLGRAALRSFPAKTGVTANLEVNYRKRVVPRRFYVLTATVIPEKSSETKAHVKGRLEDLDGNVYTEASGIFVVPKHMKLTKISGDF